METINVELRAAPGMIHFTVFAWDGRRVHARFIVKRDDLFKAMKLAR